MYTKGTPMLHVQYNTTLDFYCTITVYPLLPHEDFLEEGEVHHDHAPLEYFSLILILLLICIYNLRKGMFKPTHKNVKYFKNVIDALIVDIIK